MTQGSRHLRAVLTLAMLATSTAAHAEQSNEDRLRDALRQTVSQMRQAQDAAAAAAAQLTQAQSDLAATKAQLDAATTKLAAAPPRPQARPEDVKALQDELAQARAQSAALQQGLVKYQGAYSQVQDIARQKDAESRQAASGLASNTRALETCKATNRKLIDVSEQVLHLYESQSFRSILLRSYEPFVGTAKVKLENMVQDYDDKIQDQEYVPPAKRP